MRRWLIILIFLIGAIATMRGQNIEGTLPHTLDRAISVWARDRININFDSIYHRSGDSTWTSIDLKYIDFDLTDGWSQQEGRVGWNDDDKTLEVGLDRGSILQLGQEIHVRATNKTGDTIDNGQVVYVSGAQGSRPTIALADNDTPLAYNTIGFATQEILNNATGYVTMIGLVRDVNTSAFSAGDILWVDSIAGGVTSIRPEAPRTAVVAGIVLNSNANEGIIGVRITTVPRLAYLADVDARGNQNDNDVLVWRADSLEWEPDSTLTLDSVSLAAVHYSDTYWDDLRVPLTNTRVNPVNTEPDFEDRGDGIFAWGFDPDSDSTWVLNFTAQTPHERKDSSTIEAHIHWQPDGTNTGSVVWKLVYSVANVNGEFTTTDTLRVVDPADGVTLKHQLIDFGEIAGSDTLRISAAIMGHVGRMGDAADDTYTGTAYGIELDFHYQTDSPGSRDEYVK